jgi:choline dehydrogenase-like flavoprotein
MARANLTVETGALATGVVIWDGRAVGVRYRRDGAEHEARAGREVLLSGGAVNSPHLLLLSGVGPADQLRAHGIHVVVDAPWVGGGLQVSQPGQRSAHHAGQVANAIPASTTGTPCQCSRAPPVVTSRRPPELLPDLGDQALQALGLGL